MTREEAIEIFKRLKENAPNEMHLETVGTAQELFEMAIQALSQEPCDDVISRQAALEAVSEGCQEWRGICGRCEELINALPSVTQKCEKCAMNGSGSKYCDNCGPKSGKWTLMYEPKNMVVCSECGKCAYMYQNKTSAFCPHCGAMMFEPQKSEGDACKDCDYNDGKVHAECVVCDKAENEGKDL